MDAKNQADGTLQIESFNPRARDGREKGRREVQNRLTVSIHAPVMDAKTLIGVSFDTSGFNPRARDGREI